MRPTTGVPTKQGTTGIKGKLICTFSHLVFYNNFLSVLENVTLNTGNSAKLVSSSGRSIDLSKITVLNSLGPVKSSSSSGNVLLMPDGKIKAVGKITFSHLHKVN